MKIIKQIALIFFSFTSVGNAFANDSDATLPVFDPSQCSTKPVIMLKLGNLYSHDLEQPVVGDYEGNWLATQVGDTSQNQVAQQVAFQQYMDHIQDPVIRGYEAPAYWIDRLKNLVRDTASPKFRLYFTRIRMVSVFLRGESQSRTEIYASYCPDALKDGSLPLVQVDHDYFDQLSWSERSNYLALNKDKTNSDSHEHYVRFVAIKQEGQMMGENGGEDSSITTTFKIEGR